MGMFDTYHPDPNVRCPYCGREQEWQGKDGPCLVFHWRQGVASPISQDADIPLAAERMAAYRLPPKFVMANGSGCRYCPTEAIGSAVDDVWTSTTIMVPSDAPFHEIVDLNENREYNPHKWRRFGC